MQNIIDMIQNGDITNNQLLQKLTTLHNDNCDEVDGLQTLLSLKDKALEEQSYILVKQNEALQVQDKNKSTLLLNEQSLKQQSVSFQLECKNLKHKLNVLTNEAKAAREQTKRNKAAIKLRDDKIARLEKAKSEDVNLLGSLATVYSKGDDVLLIYPARLTVGVDGKRQEQAVLLYSNREGCFVTCFLDNDDEVACSTFINNDAPIKEQTRALINKHTMSMSDEAAVFAQSWLYRVNRVQGMKINKIDMACFK